MKIHEFGETNRPLILLLPGTCCYWKANFKNVAEDLTKDFRVGIVAYSGFDESSDDEFISMEDDSKDTEIHVFYAKKMGEKYLTQYKQHFQNPVIHEQDMRHEEFLGVYPDQWVKLVKEICLPDKNRE